MIKNKILYYRKLKSISQKKLAYDMKVSRQTIYAIENHKYNPSLELAIRIAKYFDVSVEDIFILKEDKDE